MLGCLGTLAWDGVGEPELASTRTVAVPCGCLFERATEEGMRAKFGTSLVA